MAASSRTRIAQISDLHVPRRAAKDAREFDDLIDACISHVNAAAPDLVIVTGDLTQSGHEEEYRRLRELLGALSVPYFLLPGNHDEPEALRRVYSDHTYLFESSPHVSYALDAGAVRLLAVDSTKPGRPGGYLDAARLSWLQTQLRIDPQRPVLLALHHPPFAAGVWPLDWLGYINVHELARLVRAHPQIRRIVGGHVHCARAAAWAGTYACTSPSIKPQRLLLCERWRAPVLRFEEPGFLLHSFEGDGEVRTSVHRVNGTIEELHVNADVMPR